MTKSEDLSVMSLILLIVSSFANLVYSIVLDRTELIIASVLEIALIAVTLVHTVYYECENRHFAENRKLLFIYNGSLL